MTSKAHKTARLAREIAGGAGPVEVELRVPKALADFLSLVGDLSGESRSTVATVLLSAWIIKDRQQGEREVEVRIEREEARRAPAKKTPRRSTKREAKR